MSRLLQRFGPLPSEIAARIRAERERIGLTQWEAARLMGVTRSTYKQLEITANPQLSTLCALIVAGFDGRRIAPELFGDRPIADRGRRDPGPPPKPAAPRTPGRRRKG